MEFQGVFLEENLPLTWRPLADSALAADERNHINLEQLRVISSLDDYYAPALDLEEASGISQEFQRLDAKLNVVMQMLGRLLVRDVALPSATQVVLQLDRLHWQLQDGTQPRVGEKVEIEVYLKRNFPFALMFAGEVVVSAEGWASAVIAADHNELSELMGKYVFRAHRRQIAQHRKPSA